MKHENLILQQPQLLLEGIAAAQNVSIAGQFDQIVVCGMGGSGMPGEFLKLLIANFNLKLPVHLNRNYQLPYQTTAKTLIIAVSYSGNTEEIVSSYQEAVKRKLKTIAISTGGQLKDFAASHNQPYISVAEKHPEHGVLSPRFGLFPMLGALLQVLANTKIVEQKHINDLQEVVQNLKPEIKKSESLYLAEFLKNKIPLVYTSHHYKALATNWKLQLNESAEIPCFINVFSELNHNEMVGFANSKLNKNFATVIMRGSDEHQRIAARMKLTAELLEAKGVPVRFVELTEQNIWERILQNSLLGDWLALSLAEHYKVDPTTSEMIEDFKKKLTSL